MRQRHLGKEPLAKHKAPRRWEFRVAGKAALGELMQRKLRCLVLRLFVPLQHRLCLAGKRVAEKVEMLWHILAMRRQIPGVLGECPQCRK